jgi:hypothetical protein
MYLLMAELVHIVSSWHGPALAAAHILLLCSRTIAPGPATLPSCASQNGSNPMKIDCNPRLWSHMVLAQCELASSLYSNRAGVRKRLGEVGFMAADASDTRKCKVAGHHPKPNTDVEDER